MYKVEGASEVQTQLGALNNVPKGQRAETIKQVSLILVPFFCLFVKKPYYTLKMSRVILAAIFC